MAAAEPGGAEARAMAAGARGRFVFKMRPRGGFSMRRFAFVAFALSIVVLTSPARRMVLPAPTVSIKLATPAPSGTSYDLILRQMGEKWRKATNGEVNLRVYPGGNQGSEADIVRRMNVGELQAAMLTVGGLSEIDPTAAALQEIPMLFNSLDEESYVREKMRADFERRLLAKGFVALFWGDSGWVRFFSRNPGIKPDDFKNMKIFVTASNSAKEMQIIQGLGYKPVALDWADALIQLQTGGVDAVPAPPILALSGQYYTVVKHMFDAFFGRLRGGPAVVTVIVCSFFTSFTGASGVTILALGGLLMPI